MWKLGGVLMNKTLKIISDWDPLRFLAHDAPDDEYKEEARLIDIILSQTSSANELAIGIKNICAKMFGEDFKASFEECLGIAKKLLEGCQGDGIVDTIQETP
jgi:hypothetical protein